MDRRIFSLLVFFRRGKISTSRIGTYPEVRENLQTIQDVVDISRRVNAFCLENGISPKEAFYIALCTEELAANSIGHGFKKDNKEHHVELRAVVHEDTLFLRLRDDCRRFDLVERYKMINPEDPTKNIGLRIIFKKADEVDYSSALNMNNVCVKYLIQRNPAAAAQPVQQKNRSSR